MLEDSLLIVFLSCLTVSIAEGLTFMFVYRTPKYKKLKMEVDKQSKKLEKKKEIIGESLASKNQKKRLNLEEEKLKSSSKDLTAVKMRSNMFIGFCGFAILAVLNSVFDGLVVARLPFTPISFIQGLSHRGLSGDDYNECSFIFLYILCTMSIRQNLQKFMGFNVSRAAQKQTGGTAGLFQPPQNNQMR